MTVKTGRRRTAVVQLAGIDQPPAGKWADEARKHLEQVAGSSVTVTCEKHGIFRSDSSGQSSLPVAEPSAAEEPETPVGENGGSVLDDGKEAACSLCKGTGKHTATRQDMIYASMSVYCDGHLPKCEQCRKALHDNARLAAFCPEFRSRWQRLSSELKDFVPAEETCPYCRGSGTLIVYEAARGPIIGEVFGQSGASLNLEQVRAGLATCREGAPNAWTVEQFKAQQEKRGLWSEKKR
ncbi:MAG: hypothetical protein WC485_00205 [Opitutaceae bacterium]